MNQGLYGFPSTLGIAASNIISITEFDVSGTYSIPRNAASLEIILVGGGGGGGGGHNGAAVTTSGGAGGGGGSIVYADCLIVEDLPTTTLNVTIGAGGAGGQSALNSGAARAAAAGGPGGNSSITMSGFPGLFLRAQGGAGGGVSTATTLTTAGVATGGAGKISNLKYVQVTNASGQNGGFSTAVPSIIILDSRNNGGGGGGSQTSATVAFTGGSIEISTNSTATNSPILYHISIPMVGNTFGITAAYGGRINSGPTLGAGENGRYMIGNSMKLFGGGMGGAGGGASISGTATLGGGNGGNGYRGGGGGGGGSSRVATVPGGTGGNGGNGYCCIIARA